MSVCNITVDLTQYILGNTKWQHDETTARQWVPKWDLHNYNWSRWVTLTSVVQVSTTCLPAEKICGRGPKGRRKRKGCCTTSVLGPKSGRHD